MRLESPGGRTTGFAMEKSILIVEDHVDLAAVLRRHLIELGCRVVLARSGEKALQQAEQQVFDLVLLDVMLPGIDGLEVCRRIRSQNSYTPILMLTARSSELDKVVGLEVGADDYLTKPFSMRELIARVKAIFRRAEALSSPASTGAPIIQFGSVLEINVPRREVVVRGRRIELTNKEFELLLHFAQNPGRVYTRAQLLDTVWGYSHEGYEHAVNCHINRLRAKIEEDQRHPKLIQTVWGVGYKISDRMGEET